MSWRARPICMACQRVIHGPGTGVVGPVPSWLTIADLSRFQFCALCRVPASPLNIMRLWADEGDPEDGLDPWSHNAGNGPADDEAKSDG